MMFALAFILAACESHDAAAPRTPPKTVSQTFTTAEEAFNTMLNSNNRNVRYTATLYLKQKKDEYEGTIKGYGNILFKVSHEHLRKRVYESMGWFGGSAVVSLLTYYLTTEEQPLMKMEIIRALGVIGPDASSALTEIEQISIHYAQLAGALKGGGKVIIKGPNGEYEIDPANMVSPKAFQRVADEAMAKIRGQTSR